MKTTDDRVAANLADELEVAVVNTAQPVKAWADASDAACERIAETVTTTETSV